MRIRKICIIALFMAISCMSFAQSRDFRIGKWVEINSAILQELNKSYVDSLPLNRMEKVGIDAMLANLDPYTIYVPQENDDQFKLLIEKKYGGLGAIIYKPKKDEYLLINEPYKNTPASRAGLQCGDEVLKINGKSTKGLTAKECTSLMKGRPGTDLTLTLKKVRSGIIKDVKIKRALIHLPDVEYYGMLNDTTGYLIQSGFTAGVADTIKKDFLKLKERGMKKFILDLRSNGGGMLSEALKIVSLFVPKNSLIVSQKGNSILTTRKYMSTTEPIDTLMPIVVLVNGGSASASEIVSGALQDRDRATIMGSRTYGKGLVQSVKPLPYGGQLKVTIAKYYTPSGRCVQAIDYAKRAPDGSVQHIPDSLTHEFKTLHGRIVKDGGGITPDVKLASDTLNRVLFSLVINNIIGEYPLEFVKTHDSIPAPDKFKLSDKDFQNFIAFAKSKKFDCRTESKAEYDKFVALLKRDGLKSKLSKQLDSINKKLNQDVGEILMENKSEILPMLEAEIIARYYYRPAAIAYNIKTDKQLAEALKAPLIKIPTNKISKKK